ncbi:MAG TPA: hypothetical protein VHB77_06270 [Planctomycetaceae bacterium]|nr:hypothetical protein [Planctomycetaceae bacterium]
MNRTTRREFLGEVGRGMLLAGLGASLAQDLGLARLESAEAEATLSFGALEPLVVQMQETAPAQLTAALVNALKSGTDLRTLVAAGALANARTFGGEDYIGFHTFMALAPAYRMSQMLPAAEQPLPVLKVLYRNANRIQEFGGRKSEVLHPVAAAPIDSGSPAGEQLRDAVRRYDMDAAERTFATIASGPVGEAFNHLQYEVDDEVDVHRVVLAWRAFDTLDLAGEEWAHCLLRQSVRYCVKAENWRKEGRSVNSPIRTLLPQLLDQYKLLGREPGQKTGDDAWLSQLAGVLFRGTREQAADAVAQALQEGYSVDAIGEALSLASNWLVLHDPGRPQQWANAEKPEGSCHGDSVGVHASDAANAWRNIARVSNPRNAMCSLIVGAFHTAGQSQRSNPQPYPLPEHLAAVKDNDPQALLREAEAAIREKDQFRTAAIISRYGELGHDPKQVFQLMLGFATSEDGALHAEKYYNTVSAEFAAARPAFRWGQLVALARVTASEYGRPAPGYVEAKSLLKV